MLKLRIVTGFVVTLLLLIAPVRAQEDPDQGSGAVLSGTGATASGETMEPEEETVDFSLESIQQRAAQAQWEARQERSKDFRSKLLQTGNLMEGIRLQRQNYLEKRQENRSQCRRDIRKASKITKLKTNLRCYREELSAQLDLLEKERIFVEQIPGVTDDVRWLTLTRIDLLIDALAVVITAIDSNVYELVEELTEVKENLYINYRTPYWLMMTRLRADRLLTWTASVMTRIGEIAEEEQVNEAMAEKILEALSCLTEEEELLEAVADETDLVSARELLRSGYSQMRECADLLKEAHTLRDPVVEEEVVEEEAPTDCEADSTLSRRLRRRLGSRCDVYGE